MENEDKELKIVDINLYKYSYHSPYFVGKSYAKMEDLPGPGEPARFSCVGMEWPIYCTVVDIRKVFDDEAGQYAAEIGIRF